MNLPKLKGTPKQVAWAEKIRESLIKQLEAFEDLIVEDFNLLYDTDLKREEVYKIINYIMKKEEATYFIDNRDLNIYKLMRAEMENALKEEEAEKEEAEKEEAEKEEEIAVEAKEELTVRPENAVTERAAEIKDEGKEKIKKEIKERRRKMKEKILRKAEEITEVSPRRWEGKNGIVRYYFNYGSNKTIYFCFREDGTIEAKANRPGATTEIYNILEEFGLEIVDKRGNWSRWSN